MPQQRDPVLDEIQREVKGFGEDVDSLRESMNRDLDEVRKVAEEAKSAIDHPEVKAKVDALTTSVTEKHGAIEKTVDKIIADAKASVERLDGFEKKLNRPLTGGDDEVGRLDMKGIRDFHRAGLAARGELKVGTNLSDANIDVDGVKAYDEAFPLYLRGGSDAGMQGTEHKTMSVGIDPDGGYLVSPTVSQRMLGVIYESSPLRALATVETIGSDAIEFPIDDDEVGAGWVGEAEDRPETATPKGGVQRIPVHELYAFPKVTQKLLEDASIDIEGWLSGKIGEKFGRTEATAFVSGDGVMKPRGFLTYAAGTGRGKIEQVASGAAADVTFDGLINLVMSLKEFYSSGASFLTRRASIGRVMLLKDNDGQYLWRPSNQAGQPSLLLGHPVREAADMPVVAAGSLAIGFGNWRQAYTIVDRIGVSTLRDPYTAKPFVGFYTRKRVGGDVTNFEALKLLKIAA